MKTKFCKVGKLTKKYRENILKCSICFFSKNIITTHLTRL